MHIKKIELFTDKLESVKHFYTKVLGCLLLTETKEGFSVQVGASELHFVESKTEHIYHYCFLIPRNKLAEAFVWMEQRTELMNTVGSAKTQWFDSWNAESFYFRDGSDNIVEFIVRHDLDYECTELFNASQIVNLNEIGMPISNISYFDKLLEEGIGSKSWKGDTVRFGTHGTQEGLILMPNFKVKTTWFPTGQTIVPEPFRAWVSNDNRLFCLNYKEDDLFIEPM